MDINNQMQAECFKHLRGAAHNLMDKDENLNFMFRHYMMKHSSVNGLMELSTVQEVFDMIVEYARGFIDASSSAEAKAIQQRTKERKRFSDQSGVRNSGEMECYGCGTKDHFLRRVIRNRLHFSKEIKIRKHPHRGKLPQDSSNLGLVHRGRWIGAELR